MLKKQTYSITEYNEIANVLKTRLGLQTDLVALKYIRKNERIKPEYVRPLQDWGRKITICMAMTDARRNGCKLAITAKDNPCTPSSVAHGWAHVPSLALVRSQVSNKWQSSALAVIRNQLARLRLGGVFSQLTLNRFTHHRGVLVSPLSTVDVIPDTVVLYGLPEQITHVVHALSFEGRHIPQAAFTGFAESCYVAGLLPKLSHRPIFVLLGMGDRALRCADSTEVAMGMPSSLLFYLNSQLYKAGGEHSLKALLGEDVPLERLDESVLPGWNDIGKLMRTKASGTQCH